MDELKSRAGEKLEALQVAAKTAADNGKVKVQDVFERATEAVRKVCEAFNEVWHNELIAEGRERAAAWAREAWQRVKEGAPPLSPVLLYEELVDLFKDRVWRRSMMIFMCGVLVGGCTGVLVGLRVAARPPHGPHTRALHTNADQTIMLVEDAVSPSASTGEVLIRVQAVAVCPVDRAVLRGRGQTLRNLITRTQLTVGRGFAGVVLDVGAGVTELELGDEVWGCLSEWGGGAATELLTVRSSHVSKRPRSVTADSAASLPWAGAAALEALKKLNYTPDNCKGKRVVVCGAAGGEGCVLAQALAAWGAHLTAMAPHHATLTLQDLGFQEFIEVQSSKLSPSWAALEHHASRSGPWDAVIACYGAVSPVGDNCNVAALLKSTAPRNAIIDLRPTPLLTDRLPTPFALMFAASFYSYRMLRWLFGGGTHTDWLEPEFRLKAGLDTLNKLVDCGQITPVLDKVYLPQDYEAALAHACSDDAIGTTVIRFP